MLAKRRAARSRPGARAAYSNIGYLALGEVIAAAAGCPYDTFVRNQILVPLHMERTAFSWTASALGAAPHVTAYQRVPRTMTPLLAAVLPYGLLGARAGSYVSVGSFEVDGAAYGGLIGPVSDAARFLALFTNRGTVGGLRILRPQTVEAMTTIATPGRPYDFGLAWFRPHDEPTATVEHLGGGMGYWNVLRLDPTSDRGAVVMSNTTRHWDIAAFADAAIHTVLG